MNEKRTQFALLEEDGTPVETCKQDDSCYPLVADTIEGLICEAAESHDLADDDFARMLLDPDSEYGRYSIICETITKSALTKQDKEILQQIAEED